LTLIATIIVIINNIIVIQILSFYLHAVFLIVIAAYTNSHEKTSVESIVINGLYNHRGLPGFRNLKSMPIIMPENNTDTT
jgi:hypothetical protein